jgi:ABC-type polysaccharide/polyol phosphate transport system ATPase subunit
MSATKPADSRQEPPASPPCPAVSIDRVSKAFRLPHQRYHTIKERALHPLRSSSFDVLQAVNDVSVEVAPGEFFGIVGRNGSGKSTLLKCIAGIYGIDSGRLDVRGRLSPFIELGVGFNMDLTARDNILINAVMLGLTRREARRRFDHIINFAELEEFLDLKLKNYSSGMLVRLGFSVAIQTEADILLIDEVLAVGDAAFQQKCFDEFYRLKREQKTILFVTHDMWSIERFCDRAMVLEKGRSTQVGDPAAIARRYNQICFGHTVHETAEADGANQGRPEYRPAEIVDAWFEGADGLRIADLPYGEPCEVCMEVSFHEEVTDPIFGMTLRNQVGHTVFATSTEHGYGRTGRFQPFQTCTIRLRFENCLAASKYALTPSVARTGTGADALDLREDMASLMIHGGVFTGGVVNLPHSFEVVST